MVIREWRARAPASRASDLSVYFRTSVLAELKQTPGFVGAHLSQRHLGGGIEFLVLTMWHSMDSVRAYAGHDVDRAVLYPEVVPFLTEYDRSVQHYEVLHTI